MTFRVLDALPILTLRFGETVNKVPNNRSGRLGYENQKVMGFAAGNGKVLAVDVEDSNLETVKIWIEPPVPPAIAGITVLQPKESHDLHRSVLASLGWKKGIYLQADNKVALLQLLDWYT